MKIVCESCGAKYSIADEKVMGKVFKIRCKRCSEVIVVRGDQPAEAAAPATPAPAGGEILWHVVVNGEQHGPYPPQTLGDMMNAGQMDWESYVWCEGLENWIPARDAEQLVSALSGQARAAQSVPAAAAPTPAPAPASEPAAAAAAAAPAQAAAAQVAAPAQAAAAAAPAAAGAGTPSMGADPFGDSEGGGLFGQPASPAGAAGGDLFSAQQQATSPFDRDASDEGVVASAPSPRVDVDQAMTGARNENSVLFSLKNLQTLATGSGESQPPAAATGFASGEGSGLIDIRSLAESAKLGDNKGGGEEKEDLLSLGAQGAGFSSLGSPMLSGAAEEEPDRSKMILWGMLGGAAIIAMGVVGGLYLMRGGDQAAPPVAATAATAPAAAAEPGASAAGTEQPSEAQAKAEQQAEPQQEEPPSEGELSAAKLAEEQEKADKAEARDTSSSRRRRAARRSRRGSRASGSKDSEPKPEPKSKPAARKAKGGDSLDALLEGALGSDGKRRAKRSSGGGSSSDSNLPKHPSRGDVLRAMKGVSGAVQQCGNSGVAMAKVKVSGKSGRVMSANVSGVTGSTASCVARAVRRARFSKFKQPTFSVSFPFRLN